MSSGAGVEALLANDGVKDTWSVQDAVSVSRHSGLSLPFSAGRPVIGEFAESRVVALRVKRVFDVVAAGLAIAALLPLLIIVAVLIKLTSPGPVFFRQPREGFMGSTFEVMKFRSMRVDAGDITGVDQTVRNDPRVTWIGRIIRRTSIDELPQLLNVLRGDMSLVGPRPHVAGMKAAGMLYRELVPYYDLRLQMLPGLTGWAQANGLRGETTNARVARARVDHDIAYIRNFSLWLDVKIIFKTILREFVGGSGH